MFSPTRTALYLAIGVLSFASNEAAAVTSCKVRSPTNFCANTGGYVSCYCPFGSEIGSVTVDPDVIDGGEGGIFRATWDISNYITVPPVEEGDPTLYCKTGGLPPGTQVCGPVGTKTPSSAGPIIYPDVCETPDNHTNGAIYGIQEVKMNGHATAGFLDFDDPLVVCSRNTVTLEGKHASLFGDVDSPVFKIKGGANFVGDYDQESPDPAVPVAGCPPLHGYGPPPTFSNSKGKFDPNTGELKVPNGGTATLTEGVSYCFSKVELSPGSLLAVSGLVASALETTIYVTGDFRSAAKIITGGETLTINSLGKKVAFSDGGNGEHLIVNANGADIEFTGEGTYTGAFTGKTVKLGGGVTVNNSNASAEDCTSGDFCTAQASQDCESDPQNCNLLGDIKVAPGQLCDNGGALLDHTADTFIGHAFVEQCQVIQPTEGEPFESCFGTDIYQLCNRVGDEYDCHTRLVGGFGSEGECFADASEVD